MKLINRKMSKTIHKMMVGKDYNEALMDSQISKLKEQVFEIKREQEEKRGGGQRVLDLEYIDEMDIEEISQPFD